MRQPSRGYVIASNAEGRILARVRTGHRATLQSLHAGDPIGKTVRIVHEKGVNFVEAGSRLCEPAIQGGLDERTFDNLLVRRDGQLLEVQLNRTNSEPRRLGKACGKAGR